MCCTGFKKAGWFLNEETNRNWGDPFFFNSMNVNWGVANVCWFKSSKISKKKIITTVTFSLLLSPRVPLILGRFIWICQWFLYVVMYFLSFPLLLQRCGWCSPPVCCPSVGKNVSLNTVNASLITIMSIGGVNLTRDTKQNGFHTNNNEMHFNAL